MLPSQRRLFPKALRFLFALLFIGGIVVLSEAHAKPYNAGRLSCAKITGEGWYHMPIEDVTNFALANPNADKLGYGSSCHIGSLVFAQCFLEPQWSVQQAVDELINKALAGEPLPGERVCGA